MKIFFLFLLSLNAVWADAFVSNTSLVQDRYEFVTKSIGSYKTYNDQHDQIILTRIIPLTKRNNLENLASAVLGQYVIAQFAQGMTSVLKKTIGTTLTICFFTFFLYLIIFFFTSKDETEEFDDSKIFHPYPIGKSAWCGYYFRSLQLIYISLIIGRAHHTYFEGFDIIFNVSFVLMNLSMVAFLIHNVRLSLTAFILLALSMFMPF